MSKWIEHVKSYAKDNNISYKQALSEAGESYKSINGGKLKSKSSGYVRRLLMEDNFDITKIKEPSDNLLKRFKKTNVKKEEDYEEEDYEDISMEIQKLLYIKDMKDIKKVLVNMKYKGRIQSNRMLLVLQILQNFKDIEKLIELRNELKKV